MGSSWQFNIAGYQVSERPPRAGQQQTPAHAVCPRCPHSAGPSSQPCAGPTAFAPAWCTHIKSTIRECVEIRSRPPA
eukprot:1159680-Pelagomonas_calceolata.AAC.2